MKEEDFLKLVHENDQAHIEHKRLQKEGKEEEAAAIVTITPFFDMSQFNFEEGFWYLQDNGYVKYDDVATTEPNRLLPSEKALALYGVPISESV